VTVNVAVTCTDAGSGVWVSGVFVQASATNGPLSQTIAYTAPTSFNVIPYVSGSISIIGVWAVDNAGNSVVYGSCGSAQGYDSMGCAGSGSSSDASTVAISMFSLVFVALYALFA